jgi:hypothetical protein
MRCERRGSRGKSPLLAIVTLLTASLETAVSDHADQTVAMDSDERGPFR